MKENKLSALLPTPKPKAKRKFIAVAPEDYDFISLFAKKADVSRGSVLTALVAFYKAYGYEDDNNG